MYGSVFGDDAALCVEFMRHKRYLVSPNMLRESGIPFQQVPVVQVVQVVSGEWCGGEWRLSSVV